MPAGRPPTPYDPELADELCERWATEPKGLVHILADLSRERRQPTPSLRVIYRWLEENEEFREKSARARRLRADTLHDLKLQHALEPLVGETRTTMEWGEQIKIGDNVQRSQLIVQTLDKIVGQLEPKKYGDRLSLEHSVDDSLAKRLEAARASAPVSE